MRLNTEEKKMGFCEQRLTDLERSSHHWRECQAKSIRISEQQTSRFTALKVTPG